MKKIPPSADEQLILAAVEEWVDLLVLKKYQEALDYLFPIQYPQWDALFLENWIKNYGFDVPLKDGRSMEVTARGTATGKHYGLDYEECEPEIDESTGLEVIGTAFYNIPLNGEWSDLTAQFKVCRYEYNLVLDMYGLHVM